MFLDATAFDQDISGWCVPGVSYDPPNFDTGSGFEGQTAKQPKWGTCPSTYNGGLTITSGSYVYFNGSASEDCEVILSNGAKVAIRKGNFNVRINGTGRHELPMKFITNMRFVGTSTSTKFTFDPEFNTKKVTNLANCFKNCRAFNGDISNWDVSKVTDMSNMFVNCYNFNTSISGWNVSKVERADNAFGNCSNFNQDMAYMNWGSCENMTKMFFNCKKFNGDVSVWRTGTVTNMVDLFHNAWAFDGDLNAWDTSNVVNTQNMFNTANVYNQPMDLWDMSKVTCMRDMFRNAKQFEQDISGWCTSSLTSSAKPTGFDSGAKFANKNDLQPDWQTCPPQPIRGVIPIIQTVGGGFTADPGDVIEKIEDGFFKQPDGTPIPPVSQQWQQRDAVGQPWVDITGETGDTYHG